MSHPQHVVVVSPESHESNGLGTAGFVISLVGFLTCGVISPLGLILSLIGCFFTPRGLAIAGLVLGLVGSTWLWIALSIFVWGAAASARLAQEAREAREAHELDLRERETLVARDTPLLPAPSSAADDPAPPPHPPAGEEPAAGEPLVLGPPQYARPPRPLEEFFPEPSPSGSGPKPRPTPPMPPQDEFREWTSVVGTTIDARFRGLANGVVRLERRDGSLLEVALEQLSAADQLWIRRRR